MFMFTFFTFRQNNTGLKYKSADSHILPCLFSNAETFTHCFCCPEQGPSTSAPRTLRVVVLRRS